MPLNWDDLKVLLAVSCAGSFIGAAQLVGVDQSIAMRRLAGLEADLGAILFVHAKTGLSRSEAGELASGHALEIESRTRRLGEEIANAGRVPPAWCASWEIPGP